MIFLPLLHVGEKSFSSLIIVITDLATSAEPPIKLKTSLCNTLRTACDVFLVESLTSEEKEIYTNLGIKEIKEGKLAVVTMAGGQGTRLRSRWT